MSYCRCAESKNVDKSRDILCNLSSRRSTYARKQPNIKVINFLNGVVYRRWRCPSLFALNSGWVLIQEDPPPTAHLCGDPHPQNPLKYHGCTFLLFASLFWCHANNKLDWSEICEQLLMLKWKSCIFQRNSNISPWAACHQWWWLSSCQEGE